MVTLQDRVKLVKSESDRLKEYLTGLPSDAWSRASACDAWQVRDVVGHLTWAAEGFADSISRGVGGDASAQAPFDFSPETAKASSLAEHIAQCAIDHREAWGDRLLAAFITSSDRLNQAFRHGDAVYGLQFHLEVDEALIQRWLPTSDHVRELDGLDGHYTP